MSTDLGSRPPLQDLRIIAVEQYGAGPFGSLHLADLGAEVIKIEDPGSGGDVGRYVPPHQEGTDSLFFESFNRGKRSIALDLTNTAGRRVFEDLVRISDAVFYNLRGDVPERLRLTYRHLSAINPRIVCCSLSGFGSSGPRATAPGYDYVLQGMAGWMSITGEPDGPPAKSGLSLVDYCGGLVAAMSLLAAVHRARRDGVGADCDVSLFDTALSMLTYPAAWHLNGGFEPVRTHHSAHPSLVPFQAFHATDGWLVVCCPKEKFWRRLAVAVGREDLLADERYEDFAARNRNSADLLAELDGVFATESVGHWLGLLEKAQVPCGPVNTIAEALTDPQAAERGMVVETEHPRFGTVRQMSTAVRVDGFGPSRRRAPALGEDLDHYARELGYSTAELARLSAAGAFGAPAEGAGNVSNGDKPR